MRNVLNKYCQKSVKVLKVFPILLSLQASHRYGLNLVDGGLPAGSLAQGLDVIDVMRNVHLLATQCPGEMERNPKTKTVEIHYKPCVETLVCFATTGHNPEKRTVLRILRGLKLFRLSVSLRHVNVL